MRYFSVFVGLALVALGSDSTARAALLPSHGYVRTYSFHPLGFDVTDQGDGPLDTGLQSGSDFGGWTGMTAAGQARVDIQADRFLKAYAQGQQPSGGLFTPYGGGESTASWRDVAIAASTSAPVLRMHFIVDADLTAALASPTGFSSNLADLAFLTTTNPVAWFETGGAAQSRDLFPQSTPGNVAVFIGNQSQGVINMTVDPVTGIASGFADRQPDSGFWDSASFDGTHFTGTFHIDSPYDPTLGGYGWGVEMRSTALSYNGDSLMDAGHTAQLLSVTLPDGTPVPVTFDSGLQLGPASPVPEPSTLTILSVFSALGIATHLWRRRPTLAPG